SRGPTLPSGSIAASTGPREASAEPASSADGGADGKVADSRGFPAQPGRQSAHDRQARTRVRDTSDLPGGVTPQGLWRGALDTVVQFGVTINPLFRRGYVSGPRGPSCSARCFWERAAEAAS